MQVFLQCFSLLHVLGEHVAVEYWSTCKDIEYWRRVAEAGDWEAYYITYFQQGPVKLYQHMLSLLSGHRGVNYSSQGLSSDSTSSSSSLCVCSHTEDRCDEGMADAIGEDLDPPPGRQ